MCVARDISRLKGMVQCSAVHSTAMLYTAQQCCTQYCTNGSLQGCREMHATAPYSTSAMQQSALAVHCAVAPAQTQLFSAVQCCTA